MSNSEFITSRNIVPAGLYVYNEKDFIGTSRNEKYRAYKRPDGRIDMVRKRYGKLDIYTTNFTRLSETNQVDIFRIRNPTSKEREKAKREPTVSNKTIQTMGDKRKQETKVAEKEKRIELLSWRLATEKMPDKEWFDVSTEIHSLKADIEMARRQKNWDRTEYIPDTIQIPRDIKF